MKAVFKADKEWLYKYQTKLTLSQKLLPETKNSIMYDKRVSSPKRHNKDTYATNHNHRKLANLITQTTALSNSTKLSPAMWGHPRREGRGGEV